MNDTYKYAMMIVEKDGKFLSVSRKNNPNAFGFPGGKIDDYESAEDAAIRECFEETGVKVTKCVMVHSTRTSAYFYALEYSGEVSTTEVGIVKFCLSEDLVKKGAAFPALNIEAFASLDVWKSKNLLLQKKF